MDCGVKEKRKTHPQDKANPLSLLTFFYTLGIFKKGKCKKFEEADLYEVLKSCKSEKLGDALEKQVEIQRSKHKDVSIYKLLWTCYGTEYSIIGLVHLVMRSIMVIYSPWAVGRLISYFSEQSELTKSDACFYASVVIFLNLIQCVYIHNYVLIITALGIKVRTAFCSLMYRKSLKLSELALSEVTMGKIVTLMTKDVSAFELMILYGNDVWIGFMQAAIVCYLIYAKIGVAAFAGVGLFLVILPFQVIIGKKTAEFRMVVGKKTDERLQATQEALSASKIIKMFSWQRFFITKINDYRRKEVKTIVKIFLTKVVILCIGALTTKIAFYLLIMTHIWLGNSIDAELVFFILSCFQRLRHALSVLIPLGITQAAELHAAVKRIDNLLKAGEVNKNVQEVLVETPKITLKNAKVVMSGKDILHNVSVTLTPALTVLTGPTGCGKTSLLKTVLRDYPLADGSLIVNGKVSYASQEPWIFPSTVRQNILYGEAFNPQRYQQVLDVCALQFDLQQLANSDSTIIGDKGLNLSRGQKARINLARAVYRQSDIYLVDDCLTSLDANVKEHIFKNCFQKFLRHKLCVLVTHDTKIIKECEDLIIMEDNGVCTETKTSELSNEIELETLLNTVNSEMKPVKDEFIEVEDGEKIMEEDTGLLKPDLQSKESIYHEKKKSGKVDKATYYKYIKFGGGYMILTVILLFYIMTQFSKSYTEKVVSNWVNLEQNISTYKLKNITNTANYTELLSAHVEILTIFSTLIVSTVVLSIITAYLLFNFTRKASNRLHRSMLEHIMNAVMSFFDTYFIGSILNRFSKDLAVIDEQLPFMIYEFIEIFFTLAGIVILLATVNALFLIPALIFFGVSYFVRLYYLPTGRNLQRLDAATRSPMIGYLNASLDGLTTIRACSNSQTILIKEFDKHQDLYTSANYTLKLCTRAFGFFLDVLCSILITIIVAQFLIFESGTSVGDVGMAISQVFALTGLLQYGIRQWADIENKMTSTERVLEFTEAKQENKTGITLENWPSSGAIGFENVSMKYSQKTDEYILKDLTFFIEPAQKIGIVGRTGAGKTTIISTLLRLYEIEGTIRIDNVDIKTLSLDFLRKSIAVIPQDPVLFSGTIRSNLDPLGGYRDEEIWRAIERVKINSIIASLDVEISDTGSQFSAGQKQLICLARAIVSKNKIIVLDEATASIDEETDLVIDKAIKENFAECTVITIAHKLHSVLEFDRVMVVDKGRVVEFDKPDVLLKRKGAFYQMIDKVGLVNK